MNMTNEQWQQLRQLALSTHAWNMVAFQSFSTNEKDQATREAYNTSYMLKEFMHTIEECNE